MRREFATLCSTQTEVVVVWDSPLERSKPTYRRKLVHRPGPSATHTLTHFNKLDKLRDCAELLYRKELLYTNEDRVHVKGG